MAGNCFYECSAIETIIFPLRKDEVEFIIYYDSIAT